jgi:hypothetical protein
MRSETLDVCKIGPKFHFKFSDVGPMKKVIQDDLFDLIHCLDPAEKGHFSRFAQRHVLKDGNNYEQLFQLMAKMPEYDPEYLEGQLKKLGIASPLAAAKSHLKSIIFRAMRDYNSSRDMHTCLLEGLGNLAFLYEKKQYELLRKELKRLKKIAELHAEHHILFKIGDFERKLHKETAKRDLVEGMETILSEMQGQARAFQNQLQFGHLLDKMFVIANKSGPDREQAVNALLATELLSSESNALTLLARIYYHQIHAVALLLKGQYAASQAKYLAVVSLWEGAPHLIQEFPSTYRRALGNYLQIFGLTSDYSNFEEILDKVRRSPAKEAIDQAEVFGIGSNAELIWRLDREDWDGVEAMIPGLEAGLEAFGALISGGMVLAFQYHILIFYFMREDYAATRKWQRMIIDAPRSEQRQDIQRFAKLIGLLLTWLKGDMDLLEYEYRSVARSLESTGTGKLESPVLELVEALIQATDTATACTALQVFIESVSKPAMVGVFGVQVLSDWARRKRKSLEGN